MKYPKLFSPGKIGALELRNRLVMTAMGCHLAEKDGTVSEPILSYYRARARGGVGLIVTEVVRVNEAHGCMNPYQLRLTDEGHIPELRKLADTVHEHGAKIFAQLHHPGNVTYPELLGGELPVSSGDVPSLIKNQPVRPLTIPEIKNLVKDFAVAALRAKSAGIDGVELHAGHFYLIHQFLTPYFNNRADEYGGSLENRTRFLKEIIYSIRESCGDYPLMIRLSVEDYLGDEGYHLDEGIKIARLIESWSADAINVTAAGTGCPGSQSLEPISFNQGWRRHLGASIKKSVNIPVVSVTVVREPSFAEELLSKGQTDFVGSGRCYLADPEYAIKALEERDNEIRKCISCLRCIENVKDEKPIVCSVNPFCGSEFAETKLKRDGNQRRVVILGGGPAGLEAARIAGERGFSVDLYEKRGYLGGSMQLASRIPHKEKMLWFIEYQRRECAKMGVRFHLNAQLSDEQIEALNPYAIIDATGALPIAPHSIPGIDSEIVCSGADILSDDSIPSGEYIAVIGSGLTGLETAEFLAEADNAVTVIEMSEQLAPGALRSSVCDVLPRLNLRNVVFYKGTALIAIENGRVKMKKISTGEFSELPVDRVVLCMGVVSSNSSPNVHTIGDAEKPGRILEAVRSGMLAAINL